VLDDEDEENLLTEEDLHPPEESAHLSSDEEHDRVDVSTRVKPESVDEDNDRQTDRTDRDRDLDRDDSVSSTSSESSDSEDS